MAVHNNMTKPYHAFFITYILFRTLQMDLTDCSNKPNIDAIRYRNGPPNFKSMDK